MTDKKMDDEREAAYWEAVARTQREQIRQQSEGRCRRGPGVTIHDNPPPSKWAGLALIVGVAVGLVAILGWLL
jgi:hypothetical protein